MISSLHREQTGDFSTPEITTPHHPAELMVFSNPVSYRDAWALQRQLHTERLLSTRVDTLVLLQHPPVYTIGPRTTQAHLGGGEAALEDTGIPVERVSRGGSVTYHGPGQLVGYPILALSQYAAGPKTYVRLLEDVLIGTLARWDITGHRVAHAPGVWATLHGREAKIASIGVRVDRGITLHGFALNVHPDLSPFSRIMPCGLADCRMTSMAEIRRSSTPLEMVACQVAEVFSNVFRIEWTNRSHDHLIPMPAHVQAVGTAPIEN